MGTLPKLLSGHSAICVCGSSKSIAVMTVSSASGDPEIASRRRVDRPPRALPSPAGRSHASCSGPLFPPGEEVIGIDLHVHPAGLSTTVISG